MARVGWGKHATQVNTSTYADDPAYPIGSGEWNEGFSKGAGIFGFDTQTAASASSVTPNRSVLILSGSNAVATFALADSEQYDVLWVFTSGSATITNRQTTPDTDGQIVGLDATASSITLSTTVPLIFIRKTVGSVDAWYQYGGAPATTPTDITVADESGDTTCFPLFVDTATGDRAPKTGSNLLFNASSGLLTATLFAGDITGDVTGDTSGSSGSCTGNSATATESTSITAVANNSTNETVYPTFVDGATGTQGIETDTGLTYNPSTGLLTSTLFAGALTGNVTGDASGSSASCTGNAATSTLASTLTITDNESTNENNALIFTAGGAQTGGNLGLESDGTCTYNPSTGKITATGFVGALTGDASGSSASCTGNAATATLSSTVTITDNESTNESNAVIFTAGGAQTGGSLGLESDGTYTYNPSTGKVTATGFIGDVTGDISGSSGSTTGNAATATEATSITSVANNSTNETVYPTFVDGATGTQGIETDTGLTYNPSSGLLTSVGGAFTTIAMAGGIDMNEQSITEIKRFDTKIPSDVSYASTVNIDFDTNEELILGELTGNITFTGSNYGKGKHKTVHMDSDSSARTFTFPSNWIFYGTEPTTTVANKKSVLSLTCLGSTEALVRAVFVEEV